MLVNIDDVKFDNITCYKLVAGSDTLKDKDNTYLGKALEAPIIRGSGDGRELTVSFEHMYQVGRGGDFDGNKQNMFEIVECETKKGGRRRHRTITRKRRRRMSRRQA